MEESVVRQTDIFAAWEAALPDSRSRAAVAARIARLGFGLFGDVAPVGGGVSELRIHFGPGYRVYFCRRGHDIILLLSGGDKRSQRSDIRAAKSLAGELDHGHAREDH
jgi:putative addiction module killer protein